MIATVANMRKCEAAGIAAIVYDAETSETFSATSGDYFYLADDEPLTGTDGEPLTLVRRIPAMFVDIELD